MNISRRIALAGWSLLAAAANGCTDDEPPSPAPATCEDLVGWASSEGVSITSASEVPAGVDGAQSFPAHCAVSGEIDARQGVDGQRYAIGFELRLPRDEYAERLFFQGGGGTDGVLNPAYGDLVNAAQGNALLRGYAVVSTDGGHATGVMDVRFGLDPQARLDYGYNAVGRVTVVAKGLIEAFYGKAPRRSYFVGCSNGGRQAMVAASRFADQFDGILAIDPGFNLPKAALAQAWDTQQLMTAAAPGQLPRDAFPAAAITAVADAVLSRCDGLDGLADGIVHDTAGCQDVFELDADVPTCSGPDATACLSTAQKGALAGIFGGAKAGSGESLYATFPWDPGIAGGGWRFWKIDAGFAPLPLNTLVGAGALGYVFSTPPDQPDLADGGLAYQLGLDLDAAAASIVATDGLFTESAMEFMTPPDPTRLATLKDRGGKLIVVHGSADPVFSSDDSVAWYRALLAEDAAAASYAQLFLVPQMNHCEGGPATERFDMLPVLEGWVEDGVAPGPVESGVDPANPDVLARGWPSTRTRPLCPYPAYARASASAADSEDGGTFACDTGAGEPATTAEARR